MATDGWVSLSLKESLVKRIDAFLAANAEGFSNRAEVIAAALRQFLDAKERPFTRLDLMEALQAVASTNPETIEDLLSALLAELDMKVRKPPHQATTAGKSSSDSTRRR